MKEFERLNETELQKAYEVINNKILQLEEIDKFDEKEYESFLQKRIYLNQKLNRVDELIHEATRREKYPAREEYKINKNIKIVLEHKNLFSHKSDTLVSTIHAEKYFFYSDRGSSFDLLNRLGESFLKDRQSEIGFKKAGDIIRIEHPQISTPMSYHILYYNDEKKLNLSDLNVGIIKVLDDVEKRNLSNISFFGLGFYYVLTSDEVNRPRIAEEIANEVAETIITYYRDKSLSSVNTIYFGFVNNKTMNTFDKAFFKWTSLAKQDIYIQKELSRVQKNLISKNNTINLKFHTILKEISYSLNDRSTIVLLGESGIGKTHIAEIIHKNSNRSSKPFISQNCALLRSETAHSILFGWKKGSFTGAIADGIGFIQKAEGGILFLDEVGTLELDVQKMLLTYLDKGIFYSFGDSENSVETDVKIIFGTNSNLEEQVSNNQFAEDLYERIHQRVFDIPPLRERREDVKILVDHFIKNLININKYPMEITPAVIEKLSLFNWPGNIRQLKFYIEKIYNEARHKNISEITNDLINNDPPRNEAISKQQYSHLENQLKYFLGKWKDENGRFLKDIIEPIVAKIYLEDLQIPVTRSSKFLGLTGSQGKDSILYKRLAKYKEAINNLKKL
ncbi:MAG: sigma 54-interacting transcriptional regulator [Ignavibacteriae bacterium]|nr:AAA family ATPase [Ignavibacteriota bacterium]NOG98806.1 sigma 54-interacting transcriptional regulator [Ignavibacteriota bacterium]